MDQALNHLSGARWTTPEQGCPDTDPPRILVEFTQTELRLLEVAMGHYRKNLLDAKGDHPDLEIRHLLIGLSILESRLVGAR